MSNINKVSDEILENLDRDTPDRYDLRVKWYPEREHRTNGGGPTDFMGDESFYKPSSLGYVIAEPSEMIAGEISSLKLTYYCGSQTLTEGSYVRFCMRGQKPLGCRFQGQNPEEPGYFELIGPRDCELEPRMFGFKVKKGALHEGDIVQIHVGRENGFKWTPIADRYEFKVVFRLNKNEPERRLPEPVVINVLPCEFDHLEATLPCTDRNMDVIRLHITARDKFDNRVPLEDYVLVKRGNESKKILLRNGIADYYFQSNGGRVDPLEVVHEKSGIACKSNVCVNSEDYQLFIGDLHVHDFLSEAHQYTDKVYDWAIEDRNLDFVSVSIQNHGWIDNEKWAIVKYMNERYLDEGRFVTLLSNEWQHTSYGDKVIHHLGGDQPYLLADDPRTKSASKIYKLLREGEAVVVSHHSAYPAGSWCSSTNFDAVETDVERLIELWSMHGSSEGFEEGDRPLEPMDLNRTAMSALRRGLRLGFVAGSDTHSGRPGGSAKEPRKYWGGLAAIWAKSLTRRDVFEALRARRTYALTGARIILKMTVNGAFMGSEIPESENADIKIDVWAPGKIKKVMLLKNTELYKEFDVEKDEFHLELSDKTNGPAFYHCRVIQEDGNLAVCSPVWVG